MDYRRDIIRLTESLHNISRELGKLFAGPGGSYQYSVDQHNNNNNNNSNDNNNDNNSMNMNDNNDINIVYYIYL